MKNIDLTVSVPYPLETVWQGITDPKLMSQWLMPTDFKPLVGHKFTFKGAQNKFWRGWIDCTVVSVKTLEEIQFTWQNSEKQTPTLMTYTLKKTDSGTNIHAVNAGFDNTYGPFSGLLYRTMIKAGMRQEFNKKLPKVLAKL
ncbi:MAG: polyketide cyclase [Candidatus Saccharibacteria bacterium]|nr:polyketide cyclase [Candidatus Saccharibacteria bacterium]